MDEIERLKNRNQVVQEIIDFEKKFVYDLSAFERIVVDPLLRWIQEIEHESSENVEVHHLKPLPLPGESIDKVKNFLKSLKNYVLQFANQINIGLSQIYDPSEVKNYFDNDMKTVDLSFTKQACPIGLFLKKSNIIPFYGIYNPYICDYDDAMEKIVTLRKTRIDFHNFLRACELQKDFLYNNIESYLILPIQHIPRMILLLERLLKYTLKSNESADDTYQILEKAKKAVEDVLIGMNEKLRIQENRKKVVDFATKFQDTQANKRRYVNLLMTRFNMKKKEAEEASQLEFKANWIEPHRLYVKDGFLRKMCRGGYQKYIFVLFNDKLIYGKESLSRGTFGREYDCHREFDLDSLLIVNLGNLYAEDDTIQVHNRKSSVSRSSNHERKNSDTISPNSVISTGTQNSDDSIISANSLASIRSIEILSNILGPEYNKSFLIIHQPEDLKRLNDDHFKTFIVSCSSMEDKRSWIMELNKSFSNLKTENEQKYNTFTLPSTLFSNITHKPNTTPLSPLSTLNTNTLSPTDDGFLSTKNKIDRVINSFKLHVDKDQQLECKIELEVDPNLVPPEFLPTADSINSASMKKKHNFGILLEETLRINKEKVEEVRRHPRRLSRLLGWNKTDTIIAQVDKKVSDENPQVGPITNMGQNPPKEVPDFIKFESGDSIETITPSAVLQNKDTPEENNSMNIISSVDKKKEKHLSSDNSDVNRRQNRIDSEHPTKTQKKYEINDGKIEAKERLEEQTSLSCMEPSSLPKVRITNRRISDQETSEPMDSHSSERPSSTRRQSFPPPSKIGYPPRSQIGNYNRMKQDKERNLQTIIHLASKQNREAEDFRSHYHCTARQALTLDGQVERNNNNNNQRRKDSTFYLNPLPDHLYNRDIHKSKQGQKDKTAL